MSCHGTAAGVHQEADQEAHLTANEEVVEAEDSGYAGFLGGEGDTEGAGDQGGAGDAQGITERRTTGCLPGGQGALGWFDLGLWVGRHPEPGGLLLLLGFD